MALSAAVLTVRLQLQLDAQKERGKITSLAHERRERRKRRPIEVPSLKARDPVGEPTITIIVPRHRPSTIGHRAVRIF